MSAPPTERSDTNELSDAEALEAVSSVHADAARRKLRGEHENLIGYAKSLRARGRAVPDAIVGYLIERAEAAGPGYKHRPIESRNWHRDIRLAGRIHAAISEGMTRMEAAESAIESLKAEAEQRIKTNRAAGLDPLRSAEAEKRTKTILNVALDPLRSAELAIKILGHKPWRDLVRRIKPGADPIAIALELIADFGMEPSNALKVYRKLFSVSPES